MSKSLVAYFSASGATAKAARRVAALSGGELYEIRPAVPYSRADLNWLNPRSRTSLEKKDPAFRPALADTDAPVAQCDTIYLGFPIWWYVAPSIIRTFLESYDFSGKTVVLFMTSGSSGFGQTLDTLRPSLPGSCILKEGLRITRRTSDAQLKAML